MVTKVAPKKKKEDWDNEENEAKSINFKFGKPADEDYKGDRVFGVLLSKRQIPNKLSSKAGAMQWLYEVKVRECEYHELDKKKNPVEPSIEIESGETINVYGKPFFDGRMRGVKGGQVFGLKYIGDLEAKVEGHNDTKEIKVYTPRDENGEFEMDEDVVAQLGNDFDDFSGKDKE